MNQEMFQGELVDSSRILYTPSPFARGSLLYLQETGSLTAKKKHVSTRKNLDSFLFFIVQNGSGTVIYNHMTYELNAGDCAFIDCSQGYSQYSSSTQLWSLSWVHFNGQNMKEIYEKFLERSGKPVYHTNQGKQYTDLIASVYSLANSKEYVKDMSLNASLSTLLTYIMKDCWVFENESSKKPKKNIEEIHTYIEKHCQEKISLEILADQFYINKFYLTRIFKEQYGVSIMTYLNQARISRAKELLRFTNDNLDSIGTACGFQNGSYFSKVFLKLEGISPNKFRQSWAVNNKH
jgi:Response regulator containing CheY-like receiver domain and AraC-type DNA-binding domain